MHSKLFIILNAKSGHNDSDEVESTINSTLQAANQPYELILIHHAHDLESVAIETLKKALLCEGVVVAAGGDGAINAIAQVITGSGCKFGVLPQGTFNYFSRAHNIPEDIVEALHLIMNTQATPVQTGLVNDRVFLVNASVGLYPKLLQEREENKNKFGRSRLVALISGFLSILRPHKHLKLSLESRGKKEFMLTSTLFVGNNPLQMEQLGIPLADAIEKEALAAIILKPVSKFEMLRLLLHGLLGTLGQAENLINFSFQKLTVASAIRPKQKLIKVATDGEVIWLQSPLVFSAVPNSLLLIKPN